jgi:hypothetical protein
MNRLSTSTLTVLGLMLAQAPADSANIEVGNQVLISSHDRSEIQEKLLRSSLSSSKVRATSRRNVPLVEQPPSVV